jgi:hypothetical protein
MRLPLDSLQRKEPILMNDSKRKQIVDALVDAGKLY